MLIICEAFILVLVQSDHPVLDGKIVDNKGLALGWLIESKLSVSSSRQSSILGVSITLREVVCGVVFQIWRWDGSRDV